MDSSSHAAWDPVPNSTGDSQRQNKRVRASTFGDQSLPLTACSPQGGLCGGTSDEGCMHSDVSTTDSSHVQGFSSLTTMHSSYEPSCFSASEELCGLLNSPNGSPKPSVVTACRSQTKLEAELIGHHSEGNRNGQSEISSESAFCGAPSLLSPDSSSKEHASGTDSAVTLTDESWDPEITDKSNMATVQHREVSKAGGPTVFVWDLDETLIIFQTLSNGRYSELFNGTKDPREALILGRRWEKLILQVCDSHFFYQQVEDYNEPHLESLQDFDDGIDLTDYDFYGDNLGVPCDAANKRKLGYRHRVAGDLYTQGLEKLLNEEHLKEWQNLYETTDKYTDGWLSAGRKKLEECQEANRREGQDESRSAETTGVERATDCQSACETQALLSNHSMLVTSGTLIPSLVKCLLFRLEQHFHHLNIYSSRDVGKLQCFQWIKERYQQKNPKFCVIGDGIDECEAAYILEWPFVKINIEPNAVHRLPSLSMASVEHYIKIVYGGPDGPGIPNF